MIWNCPSVPRSMPNLIKPRNRSTIVRLLVYIVACSIVCPCTQRVLIFSWLSSTGHTSHAISAFQQTGTKLSLLTAFTHSPMQAGVSVACRNSGTSPYRRLVAIVGFVASARVFCKQPACREPAQREWRQLLIKTHDRLTAREHLARASHDRNQIEQTSD